MGILGRVLFQKAKVFAIAKEKGYANRAQVAKALIKWAVKDSGVHTIMLGVSSPEQLTENLTALKDLNYDGEESRIIEALSEES